MPKIFQKYAKNAKDMPKICKRYTKDMAKICQRYAKDLAKICQGGDSRINEG